MSRNVLTVSTVADAGGSTVCSSEDNSIVGSIAAAFGALMDGITNKSAADLGANFYGGLALLFNQLICMYIGMVAMAYFPNVLTKIVPGAANRLSSFEAASPAWV